MTPTSLGFSGPGQTQTLSVSGVFSDGTTRPVLDAMFLSSDAAVAAVSAAGDRDLG